MTHPVPPELTKALLVAKAAFRTVDPEKWDDLEAEIDAALAEVYQSGKASSKVQQHCLFH